MVAIQKTLEILQSLKHQECRNLKDLRGKNIRLLVTDSSVIKEADVLNVVVSVVRFHQSFMQASVNFLTKFLICLICS